MKTSFVIIHGPVQSGKTLNKEALREHYQCDIVIDDADFSLSRHLSKGTNGERVLLLSPAVLFTRDASSKNLPAERALLLTNSMPALGKQCKKLGLGTSFINAVMVSIEGAAEALGDKWVPPDTEFKYEDIRESVRSMRMEDLREKLGRALAGAMIRGYVDAVLLPEGMSGAWACVLERQRQKSTEEGGEGFTDESDDQWRQGELADAARAYTIIAGLQVTVSPNQMPSIMSEQLAWPKNWTRGSWKPATSPKRNLEKSMGLLAAEWDRLDRIEKSSQKKESE